MYKSIGKVILKSLRTGRMTKLTESLRLYLPYALSRNPKLLTYLFESSWPSVLKAETEFNNLLFSRC